MKLSLQSGFLDAEKFYVNIFILVVNTTIRDVDFCISLPLSFPPSPSPIPLDGSPTHLRTRCFSFWKQLLFFYKKTPSHPTVFQASCLYTAGGSSSRTVAF